jgi:F0F1-type ATP synthase gamma subunit
MEGDSLYFSRRANEERVAAMKAAHPNARQAHLNLARQYEELAAAIVSHEIAVGSEAIGAT